MGAEDRDPAERSRSARGERGHEPQLDRLRAWIDEVETSYRLILESKKFRLAERIGRVSRALRRAPAQDSFESITTRLLEHGRACLGAAAEAGAARPTAGAVRARGTGPAPRLPDPRPDVTVVVPIHDAFEALEACLDSLARHTTLASTLLLIDDASEDARIEPLLDRMAASASVRVLRNPENLGFVRTVNRALRATESDVVLLNSDTRVGPRWLQNLQLAAYCRPRIATATALSDNAGAFSAPDIGRANEVPARLASADVARLVAQASARSYPLVPTGSGFCMYMSRRAIREVGCFDEEAFGRGYGEENDFCMRARDLGWLHVVDDATYVLHARSKSFGGDRERLVQEHRRILDERHPEYTPLIRKMPTDPALARARERIARAFEGAAAREAGSAPRPRVLFVLHEGSGGTPQTNLDLARGLAPRYESFILSSDTNTLRLFRVGADDRETLESWPLEPRWEVTDLQRPDVHAIVTDLLARYAIEIVHVRHLLGHTCDPVYAAHELSIPVVVSFHDFYMICPTFHLLDERERFCAGECTPGEGDCRIPSSWVKRGLPALKHRWIHKWRAQMGRTLGKAGAFVTTSQVAHDVVVAAYPELAERRFPVIEHGRDLAACESLAEAPRAGGKVRILVPGNLDVHKGARFLEDVARADRGRRLELHFLGRVPERFAGLGVLHGEYAREDFAAHAGAIRPHFAGIFSIWPETYCHVLSEAWAAGIPVLVTRGGTLEERLAAHGGGWTVDADDPAGSLESILAIADDAERWAAGQRSATATGLRTVAAMAADYASLYEVVLEDARVFQGVAGAMEAAPR